MDFSTHPQEKAIGYKGVFSSSTSVISMPMIRVEFHSHTCYSKDSLTSLEDLLIACKNKKIDRIAITDHNTIVGAVLARELDPERVIIGEEIMTTEGELLAFFVQEEVPAGLLSLEAITLLRQQRAFISVSHPFDQWRSGHWDESALMEIVPLVDAIETFNARCIWPGFNTQAQQLAYTHNILGTVGSDAHAAFEIGKATLFLPEFQDADSLRAALHQAQAKIAISAPWVHFVSRFAAQRKKNLTI
jgi:predicted metal-dependent phosphoesterase TrpH